MRTLILTIALLFLVPISLYASAQPNSGSLAGRVAELEAQVAAMEEILQYVRVETEDMIFLAGPHLIFEGVNVHVRSGSGGTSDGCGRREPDYPNCESLTGLGNFIVGYNERRRGVVDRSGSHNLVVGRGHNYTSFGGLVAGAFNAIHGAFASVSGGSRNIASGNRSSVSGGDLNDAIGYSSSVSGGLSNEAIGSTSSVSGGLGSDATGVNSSVSGGLRNLAAGEFSSVSGGQDREALDDFNWVAGSLFEEN
ncbi:MAG: hypothetical protein IH974_05835 [Myxococcales bacterium]|nr:hypothetical protein [Myxococcales bacterium]